jgi:hypothetical protein
VMVMLRRFGEAQRQDSGFFDCHRRTMVT